MFYIGKLLPCGIDCNLIVNHVQMYTHVLYMYKMLPTFIRFLKSEYIIWIGQSLRLLHIKSLYQTVYAPW